MSSTLPSASDCCSPCSHTLTVTIVETPDVHDDTGAVLTFQTTADLRARGSIGLTAESFAITFGDTAAGDGNGHQYFWDEAGSDADNGASVIRPDDFSGAGIWRQYL